MENGRIKELVTNIAKKLDFADAMKRQSPKSRLQLKKDDEMLNLVKVMALKKLKTSSVVKDLETIECHFTWELEKLKPVPVRRLESYLSVLEKKVREAKRESDEYEVFRIVLDECFWFYNLERYEDSERCYGIAYSLCSELPERLHLCLGCKAHMLFQQGHVQKAINMYRRIVPFLELNEKQKAYIYGSRASSMLDLSADLSALRHYIKAHNLNIKEFRWALGIGITLRRIRRLEAPTAVPKQELNYFRLADKLGAPRQWLALCLYETAYALFQKYGSQQQSAQLNEEAYNIIIQIIGEENKGAITYLRCGEILGRLPKRFKNLELQKFCFVKAVDLEPNDSMVNHKYGKYVENFIRDKKLAFWYYQKAAQNGYGNFPDYMDMIRLKCEMKFEYDPVIELEELLERYSHPCHKGQIYAYQADYLCKVDCSRALQLYRLAVAMANNCNNPDWGTAVMKFAWELQPDGERIKVNTSTYERQNLYTRIQQLEQELNQ